MAEIRAFDADEATQVYALWHEALGETWPVAEDDFLSIVLPPRYRDGDHVVAVQNGRIVGFAATQARGMRGSIPLVLVAPDCRRRGLGRALLDRALAGVRARGAHMAQLGGGGDAYFWPGVPENLPDAVAFFQACGWVYSETSVDMTRDLSGYETPAWVFERVRAAGVVVRPARVDEMPAVIAFERRHFPGWVDGFLNAAPNDVVVAVNRDGRMTGTATLFGPWMATRESGRWRALLGDAVGGFGALGVADGWREQGIGMALAACASAVLKARGVRTCFVGWTWLVDWYAKLGYAVWRTYQMSWTI